MAADSVLSSDVFDTLPLPFARNSNTSVNLDRETSGGTSYNRPSRIYIWMSVIETFPTVPKFVKRRETVRIHNCGDLKRQEMVHFSSSRRAALVEATTARIFVLMWLAAAQASERIFALRVKTGRKPGVLSHRVASLLWYRS